MKKLLVAATLMSTMSAFASCPGKLEVKIKCNEAPSEWDQKERVVQFVSYESDFYLEDESEGTAYNEHVVTEDSCSYKASNSFPIKIKVEGKEQVVNDMDSLHQIITENNPEIDADKLRRQMEGSLKGYGTSLSLEHVKAFFGLFNNKYRVTTYGVGNVFKINRSSPWQSLSDVFKSENGASVKVGVGSSTTPNGRGGLNATQSHDITIGYGDGCTTIIRD